jgi:chemotaxis protein histidine kinase CheA
MTQEIKEDYHSIINTINNNVLHTINISLQPLWDKIEEQHNNYHTIVGVMRNMPEFKSLLVENENLKRLLKDKETELKTHTRMELLFDTDSNIRQESIVQVQESINLEVKETNVLNDVVVSDADIDDKVKLIYLDVKLVPKENSILATSIVKMEEEEDQEEEEEEEVEVEVQEEEDQEVVADQEEEADQEEVEDQEVVAYQEAVEVQEEEADQEEEVEVQEEEEEVEVQETIEDVDEEVFIVEIEDFGDVYTNDENNGTIYKITDDDDVGEKIGYFKDGEPIML